MSISTKIKAALFVSIFAASASQAAALIGIKFKDEVEVDGKKLVLNGLGLRSAEVLLGLKVNVYAGGLYLEKKSSDGAAILKSPETKLVHVVYARDIDKDKGRKAWQENYDRLCEKQCEALKPQLTTFLGYIEDMKEDKAQDYLFTTTGVKITSNGKEKGTIANPEFAKLLLRVWVESPPNPELKEGMLGLKK